MWRLAFGRGAGVCPCVWKRQSVQQKRMLVRRCPPNAPKGSQTILALDQEK